MILKPAGKLSLWKYIVICFEHKCVTSYNRVSYSCSTIETPSHYNIVITAIILICKHLRTIQLCETWYLLRQFDCYIRLPTEEEHEPWVLSTHGSLFLCLQVFCEFQTNHGVCTYIGVQGMRVQRRRHLR